MLKAQIKIGKIDYNGTFRNFFPLIMERLMTLEKKSIGVKLLIKLGESSLVAAAEILARLDDKTKRDIICSIINSYKNTIVTKLNEKLEANEIGKNVKIGGLFMERRESELVIIADDINVSYVNLLRNQTVKDSINKAVTEKAGGGIFGDLKKRIAGKSADIATAAAVFAPNAAEKLALKYLYKTEYKQSIMNSVVKALSDNGVSLELNDISFFEANCQQSYVTDTTGTETLLAEAEDKIIDAIVWYIKDLI